MMFNSDEILDKSDSQSKSISFKEPKQNAFKGAIYFANSLTDETLDFGTISLTIKGTLYGVSTNDCSLEKSNQTNNKDCNTTTQHGSITIS